MIGCYLILGLAERCLDNQYIPRPCASNLPSTWNNSIRHAIHRAGQVRGSVVSQECVYLTADLLVGLMVKETVQPSLMGGEIFVGRGR